MTAGKTKKAALALVEKQPCTFRFFSGARTSPFSRGRRREPSSTAGDCHSCMNLRPMSTCLEHGYPEKLDVFLEHSDQAFAFTTDFRHWLHQMRMCQELWPFVGVAIGSQTFVWTTLPMGWAYSPFVAWALVSLTNEHAEGSNPVDASHLKDEHAQLPFWLPLRDHSGKEVGFVSVYYDNVVAWSHCRDTLKRFKNHFDLNCNRYNVEQKDGSTEVMNDVSLGLEYLGVRVWKDDSGMAWSVKKLDKWLDELRATIELRTARSAAKWIGRLVHLRLLEATGCNGACCDGSLLELAKRVARDGYQGWESPSNINIAEIKEEFKGYSSGQVFRPKSSRPGPQRTDPLRWIVTTDASKSGGGHIIYNEDREEAYQGYAWDPAVAPEHIYLKEMRAACTGMKAFVASHPNEAAYLVVDNSAVAWSLRNGVSSNTAGMNMLLEVKDIIHMFRVVQVVGPDNPADVPSRYHGRPPVAKERDLEQRRVSTRTAIKEFELGRRWASKNVVYRRLPEEERCILRHGIPEDADLMIAG